MIINQSFRIRKDIGFFIVYFEKEGPLEMSRISADIINQLSTKKSKIGLIHYVQKKHPKANAKNEVGNVISTLKKYNLLSL